MFGYDVVTTKGQVAANELEEIFYPRTVRAGKRGCILLHGAGNPQAFIDATNQKSSVKLAAALASAGIPCIAGDFGVGDTFANDTVMARIDSAWTLLKAKFPTMATDKFFLLGGSMGGAAVARYSQLHPDRVAAVVGLIPLWDLVALYNLGGGTQATIAAAWGVTAPAALPSSADIAANASLAAGIPHLAGYSTVDTTVLPAWVTAYTAAVGGTAIITDTTTGHTDAAIGGMPIATVGQFLAAHDA